MAKTKIICTLGPSSNSETIVRNMIRAGMDVARINFSHGSCDEYKNLIGIVRMLNKKYRRHIRILQDLEGFRIRIGRLKSPIELKKRELVYLTKKNLIGEDELIPFDYRGSLKNINKGQLIFIDDGTISLKVIKATKKEIKAEVIVGGLLKEKKGINIPDVQLEFPSMTEKDKEDISFGIRHRVDYIAQSFVRNRKDIINIRALVRKELLQCQIIAKIENREGIKNIDEIIEVSDGIMIARGDMGISVPIYQIPIIQKQIIKRCNEKKRFVITATQMLENMVEHIQPTRAEVTDVANAIIDGTDFVMLSAETATGRYPVEAVRMMNRIIEFTERSVYYGRP